jgi:putative transposase
VVELTDEEWGLVEHLFDPPVHRGVKGTIPRRDIVDAILWLARTGCQWRHLPDRFPDWQAVWSQWRRWRDSGTWAAAMRVLAREVRLHHNRKADPTMVMIDAQTVKGGRAGPTFHEVGGRGGHTRGAKRTILIEILGLPLAVSVESAKPHDVQSARKFLKAQLDPKHPALPGLQAIVADRGYGGLASLAASHGLNLDIKKAPADAAAREARRQAEEGQARVHPAAPALQGRERVCAARHVAASVALLRANPARRADLARGGLRRLPVREASGRANLMAGRPPPRNRVSNRTRTSTARCATAGRRARDPESQGGAEHAATGTPSGRPPRARLEPQPPAPP